MKSEFTIHGYKYIVLRKKGKMQHFTVHRLVAKAFLDNPYKYEFLDHVDTNPSNNVVTNLRWVETHQKNVNNPKTVAKKIDHRAILQIDKQTNSIISEWKNAHTIHKTLGFQSSNILSCCRNNNRRSAYGFCWKFLHA